MGDGGEQLSAEVPWLPPATFDGYKLIRPLGSGGMGQVYLGHDLLLDRPVAIKFIAHADDGGRRLRRFLIEGRTLARIVHPNVVLMFRVGVVDGRPFLVSEYVTGSSLDRQQAPVPWRRVLDIGIGLARGLVAVHAAGIIHRDIKPANVMLTAEGGVKLIDFGLAKLVDLGSVAASPMIQAVAAFGDGQRMPEATESEGEGGGHSELTPSLATRLGAAVGTRRYMSPERLAGAEADIRSEVFALGCVLHELLWGWLPGDAHADRVIASGGQIPAELRGVLERCLDLDPARRPASVETVLMSLEALTDDAVAGETPSGNPYRGLEAFDSDHRALFLGRSSEVRAIVERLRNEGVVVVAGDSGVGKSSLCKAGVLPRIAEAGLLPRREALVVRLTPGRDPMNRLSHALGEVLREPPAVVGEQLSGAPVELLRALGRCCGDKTVVLFVDQTEELFTLAAPEEARLFGEVLAALALSGSQFRVLATVRGDFLARFAALPEIGPEVARGPYLLRPLAPDKLREVIVGPARRTGVSFASTETVSELVRSTLGSEGSLPLLQFTLAELWEARDRASNVIRADALATLGGVDGALERHADRVLRSLPPVGLVVARRLLTRLVTRQRTRASLAKADLDEVAPEPYATLEALIAGRLIVARGTDELATYELAHEALIRRWPTLSAWLEEDAVENVALERLTLATTEWERQGRHREDLWRGRQLTAISTIDAARVPARQRIFLDACQAQARRAKLIRLAVPMLLFCVVGATYLAIRLRARAEIDATAGRSIEDARRFEAAAWSKDSEAAQLRVSAFHLFDEGAGLTGRTPAEAIWPKAEELWARVLELESTAEAGHARASTALEAALFIDGGRSDVRDELAKLLARRLALAARMHNRDSERELSARLDALTPGQGSPAVRQGSLSSLSIQGGDVGVKLSIAPYVTDGSGRLVAGAGHALAGQGREVMPSGSYLLTAEGPGGERLRLPLTLERGRERTITIPRVGLWAAPPGFLLVPAGEAMVGTEEEGVRSALDVPPQHEVSVAAFLIGQFEVTFAEYVVWLDELAPAEQARHAPHTRSELGSVELDRVQGRSWTLLLQPTNHRYRAGWDEPMRYAGRTARTVQDWRRFPVTGISFEDASAYATWLSDSGRVKGAHVCTEIEWEIAARGADGRVFTTGAQLLAQDANFDLTYGGTDLAFGPDEVGSHPESASPFGVEDLHGNAHEMVASSRWNEVVATRGGSWYCDRVQQRLDNRFRRIPTVRDNQTGFRVCGAAATR